jgi:hypothetical protein
VNDYPPGGPPPRAGRRWIPAAIIAAGIIIAGVAVGGAVIASNDKPTASTGANSDAAVAGVSPENATACASWETTHEALVAIPQLPPGWNWNTPNIDVYIQTRVSAVNKGIELFDQELAGNPSSAAEAGRVFIAAHREASRALLDRTYSAEEGVPITVAQAKLNQACATNLT